MNVTAASIIPAAVPYNVKCYEYEYEMEQALC